jgi:NADH dehydrogenase FAD-containing subunit
LNETLKAVTDAQNILIVGGGVVGVQVGSELAVAFASKGIKKVSLCVRGKRLLTSLPLEAAKKADIFLRSNGVNVMYNSPLTEEMTEKGQYDLVLKCMGYQFDFPFLKKNYSTCLAQNGQIQVNALM